MIYLTSHEGVSCERGGEEGTGCGGGRGLVWEGGGGWKSRLIDWYTGSRRGGGPKLPEILGQGWGGGWISAGQPKLLIQSKI